MFPNASQFGFGGVYLLSDSRTRSLCAENPDGKKGGAWCFGDTYSTPVLGYPLWQRKPGGVPKHGLYRWHIMDPIRFDEDLRVTIQELGWWPNGEFQPLTDDLASVGYWYQSGPHGVFPVMLGVRERFSR